VSRENNNDSRRPGRREFKLLASPDRLSGFERRLIMNIKWMAPLVSAVGFVLVAGVAAQAVAQTTDASAPKTRAEVQAELLEAQRTGNIVSWGDSGRMLNELYPQNYPPKPAGQGLSREQVMAELLEAQRTGNIMSWGEPGLMLNELYPQRYPARGR
jgi:hypothetical protein